MIPGNHSKVFSLYEMILQMMFVQFILYPRRSRTWRSSLQMQVELLSSSPDL